MEDQLDVPGNYLPNRILRETQHCSSKNTTLRLTTQAKQEAADLMHLGYSAVLTVGALIRSLSFQPSSNPCSYERRRTA